MKQQTQQQQNNKLNETINKILDPETTVKEAIGLIKLQERSDDIAEFELFASHIKNKFPKYIKEVDSNFYSIQNRDGEEDYEGTIYATIKTPDPDTYIDILIDLFLDEGEAIEFPSKDVIYFTPSKIDKVQEFKDFAETHNL